MNNLNELTIKESLNLLKKGEISAVDLTQACLNQIDKTDKELNAFITINENVLDDAAAADKSRAAGNDLPLLGIPIALKDNYLTEGLRTTAASNILNDYTPQYDATVVSKLKDAGAIILGKTNMDAWAHGSSTETSDFGVSKNPLDTSRIPGGSSGGSSVAITANQTIGAMGSETAGSIRGPASWCGHVGLKPTYGRVSRYGIIAMGSSLDSPGPMTKKVYDAALLLSIVAGHDPHDATTPNEPIIQYDENLTENIKNLRIGLPEEYFLEDSEEGINESVMSAAKHLEKLGATLHEIKLPATKYAISTYTIAMRTEVFSNLSRYDGIRYGNDRTYFGKEAKRRIMLGAYAIKISPDGRYYRLAQRARTLMQEDFNKAFSNVDVILAPTMPLIAPKIGVTEGQGMFGELIDLLQEPSSLAGLPGISMPCGIKNNMPIGFQFIGRHFDEQTILNVAYAYEQSTNWKENVIK